MTTLLGKMVDSRAENILFWVRNIQGELVVAEHTHSGLSNQHKSQLRAIK